MPEKGPAPQSLAASDVVSTIRVHVKQCIQECQDSGSPNVSMRSRIVFTIGTNTRPDVEDYCDVRHTIGPRHNSSHLEVSPPPAYDGPYDHQAFTHGIAAYYAKFLADNKQTARQKIRSR